MKCSNLDMLHHSPGILNRTNGLPVSTTSFYFTSNLSTTPPSPSVLDWYLQLHHLQDRDDLLVLEPVTHFNLHSPHIRIQGCLDSGDVGI
jgi:hypothetical protein